MQGRSPKIISQPLLKNKIQTPRTLSVLIYSLILVFGLIPSTLQIQLTSCPQSVGSRTCTASQNRTQFLLSMKKGGVDVLSTDVYLYDYFLCEEYNYDCGYIENLESKTMISNGVNLQLLDDTSLAQITTNPSTYTKIQPYIGQKSAKEARCGLSIFPLTLTEAQSKQVLDGYFQRLQTEVITVYDLQRNISNTMQWNLININIRTAILATIKAELNFQRIETIQQCFIWQKVILNEFKTISKMLKNQYKSKKDETEMMILHNAYMIDSVTQQCDKVQSVNFLVDHSRSISESDFYIATRFLEMYINITNDDYSLMSIGYFHQTFEDSIQHGSSYSQILEAVQNKVYAPVGRTQTALGMNATIQKIIDQNYPNGLPKIMVVLTDGRAHDDVPNAAAWARSLGIHIIAVGIGSNIAISDLVQTAGTIDNVITVSSFSDMPKLVQFISNYFCKQIQDVKLGDYISGNYVRNPDSPSYFRIEKSSEDVYYQLDIFFEDDPIQHNQGVYQSQIDPFPDQYTEYTTSQHYEIFYEPRIPQPFRRVLQLSNQISIGSSFVPKKVYFIQPENQIDLVVKKDIYETTNVSVSYISVRGNNLGFNLSLRECQTQLCHQQRQYYRAVSVSQIPVIYDPEGNQDLSIFVGIGATLAGLALLCVIFIFGVRKFNENQEQNDEQKNQLSSPETEQKHRN